MGDEQAERTVMISMNLLMSAGTSVAYFPSIAVLALDSRKSGEPNGKLATYFDAVVFLTMFILAGRYLEAYSKAKTGDAVTMLGKLRPTEALLVRSNPDSRIASYLFRRPTLRKLMSTFLKSEMWFEFSAAPLHQPTALSSWATPRLTRAL